MKLHENKGVFRQTITTIADRAGYRRDVLEKDYYVVLMLEELSEKQREGLPAYFKGGTALYKKLKNEKRFSEDIDLSVDTRGCSGSQNKRRLNLATKGYASLERKEDAGVTNRSEVITYYKYDPIVDFDKNDTLNRFGVMMIEATSFTISEPVSDMEVTALIYDLATEKERTGLRKQFDVEPFSVKAISIERIFIDKLFAAEAYVRRSDDPHRAFDAGKHIYDLSVMAGMHEIQSFMADEKQMKRLLDIRMEEELRRLDGVPGLKPSDFIFFERAESNKMVEREYGNMQDVYVFKAEDRIPYADAIRNLHIIHDKLIQNVSWRDYKPSIISKLDNKKKEATIVNASSEKVGYKRREEVID